MVRRSLRLTVGITTLLVVSALAVAIGVARSGSALAEDADHSPQPTVVREVVSRRAEYSTTYLLSNGLYRIIFSQVPVHYKDEAGDWQPIDATFEPQPDGSYQTAAVPVDVTVADQTQGAPPVTLEGHAGTVTLDLLGASEEDPVVDGDTALYSDVLRDTDVTYTATGDGVKEELVLASSAAPSTFAYRLTHPGMSIRQDEGGQWGLYKEGASQPAFMIGALTVFDSSRDEGDEPAYCNGARMVVTAGDGVSTVSYVIPSSWLADPARVWPVTIDPSLFSRNPTDTYISQGYPGTAYGSSQELLAGDVSSATQTCKTLVRFPQIGNIPAGSHISAATFSIRCFWQPSNPNDTVKVGKLDNAGTSLWGDAPTWNGTTLNLESTLTTQQIQAQQWLNVTCPGVVTDWLKLSNPTNNKGFLVYESSSAAAYAHKFRSGEYSDADYRPKITVDYESPVVNTSADKGSYVIGEEAHITASVSSVADPTEISMIRVGINRTASDTSLRRGVFAWFKDPSGWGAPWVFQRSANGDGYFAYYNSTDYGIDKVEPRLADCSISADHKTASFAFTVLDTWGAADANQMDSNLTMTSGSRTWYSGWTAQTANHFDVNQTAGVPQALTCVSASTSASSSWFVGTGVNDTTTQGRGNLTLSWPDVPLADSYKVYLWDGVKYDLVTTTAQLTWTSPTNLYPTDSQIAAMPQNYSGNPFSTYGSRDLRDNPNALYAKMGGSTGDTFYRFKVVPHNNTAGDADINACGVLRVTLDNRSVAATGDASVEDPRHVGYDVGEWDGHMVGCLLDSGALTVSTSDLAVVTYGPAADLSRSYISSQSGAALFAPGWFFSFEQNLAITSNRITYTDADRLPHVFAGSGSVWTAPNGFFASLAPSGSNWRLTFFDQSYLTFDSAGKLLSETDDHGNTTTYTWTSGQVTRITAANGQYIALTYSGSKLSSASYATAAGTRTVNYTTTSPWTATLYPNTSVQKKLTYGYDANSRLSGVTQNDWPTSGQSASESFVYTSGKLTQVNFADYDVTTKPDARLTISYDSAVQATVKRYGTVAGVANQVMDQEVYVWSAASAGVPNQLVSVTSGTGGLADIESYTYAFDRQLAMTISSDGGLTSDAFSTAHDLTADTVTTGSLDSTNQSMTYVYDSQHRTTSETTWQTPTVWSTTSNTYNGANLTDRVSVDQAGALLSASSFSYDSQGRRTQQRKLVTGTVQSGTWTQTDYSNFAACGEPQTITARNIKLSPNGVSQDLTKTNSYDAFGNLLSLTDWSNVRTTAVNTYDLSGRQLTSTDCAGVVTHTTNDQMGNTTEAWLTANGTQMKANWTVTTYDAVGRQLSVTVRLSDANGNPTTQSIVSYTYDGSGNGLTSDDSTAGGQVGKSAYDSEGNATEEWDEGALNYTDAGRSVRSIYDAEGNLIYESSVGNPNAPGDQVQCTAVAYDKAGNIVSVKQSDGSKTLSSFDGQTNEKARTGSATSGSDFQPWQEGTSFNAGGSVVGTTAAAESHEALTTTTTRDQLGRVIEERAERDSGTEPVTTTAYNDLDWILQRVDANGVCTSNTYDVHGALVSQIVGTRTTTSSYNATSGRLETLTNPDGATITYTYDAFGRIKRELHQQAGQTTKDIGGASGLSVDSLGRVASQADTVASITHSWVYPTNAATGTQETLNYDATPLTTLAVSRNGRQMETSRTAVIATGKSATLTIADTSVGRDSADRWKQRSIQYTGYAADTETRSFDSANRLATQSGLGFASAGSYTFDANSGRLAGESLPLSLGGTIGESYGYYAGGSLAEVTTSSADELFTYDEVGNLIADTIAGVGTTTFSYDNANRLMRGDYLAASDGATPLTTYYGWDTANAWRTCQGPSANPTQANSPIDFSYNGLGRMSNYANSNTDTTASYTYDASGQRVCSVVGVAGATTTTNYAYDDGALLKLWASRGSTTWRVDYLYDEQGLPWGGVYRSPSTSAAPVYFSLITTDRGDVVELCDADGGVFAAYRYDAWGVPLGSGNYATGVWTQSTSLISASVAGDVASRQVLRYAGYAYDGESGLYYCSARYYDPMTRQWTTGDPAKADGEESPYQYCSGNPVGQADPSGLAAQNRYNGHLEFRLIKSDKSDGPLKPKSAYYVRNHRYGRLDAVERVYFPTGGSKLRRFRYPVVSGNNNLADQFTKYTGPIPGRGAVSGCKGIYHPGRTDGTWVGFTAWTNTSYSPGGWKLDPWTAIADPNPNDDKDSRGLFWIHGGIYDSSTGYDHRYPNKTAGCIRMRSWEIKKLRDVWSRWGNKKKDSCYLQVMY